MNRRLIAAVLLLFAAYFPVAIYLKRTYVLASETPKERIWLTGPFVPLSLGRAAYIAWLPKLDYLADTNEEPSQSTIVLYEDEKPVGPGHSEHTDVATLGRGRYSHWQGQGLIFSATDNSNPNRNWKRYSVTIEPAYFIP